jgi:hypothetical protein
MAILTGIAAPCAVTSLLLLAAAPCGAQVPSGPEAMPDGGNAAQPNDDSGKSATEAGDAIPGVVLERNVFVPVDENGHSASNQFIVVEKRVMLPKGATGSEGAAARALASREVPTRLILVPQDGGDDDSGQK